VITSGGPGYGRDMGSAAAVVLAGGSGSRVGAAGNKVYLPVAGRPLLSWSLAAFAAAPSVSRLVLVAREADLPLAREAADRTGSAVEIVPGGATRHGSEWAALSHLAAAIRAGELTAVAIHDGARPLASCELIEATLAAARMHGAAVPGVPLTDAGTVDPAHGVGAEPAGRRLVRVQTPQAFRAGPLLDAYERAERDGFTGTDTAACVERYAGLRVHCLPGDPRNLKVTYRADLELAAALLAQ
jgi:2-C-methyl-D-erythritol 4-phosphate cytidylyltransferase